MLKWFKCFFKKKPEPPPFDLDKEIREAIIRAFVNTGFKQV